METYFIIYKTTCVITNKFYIGMHKTSNLQDGYLGSGKLLKRSVRKYGRENHVFEILEFLLNIESLILREREIVNETLLSDKLCMNIKVGGNGGFINDEHRIKCQSAGGKATVEKMYKTHFMKLRTDEDYYNKWLSKKRRISPKGEKNGFFGKKHSKETIDNMCLSRKGNGKGEKNSQYGTCWISHPEHGTKKIKKEDLELYESQGWIKGRKNNIAGWRNGISFGS